MATEKECFNYACDRYPRCALAKGFGCCIERNEEKPMVGEDECGEANGYPLFVSRGILYEPKK